MSARTIGIVALISLSATSLSAAQGPSVDRGKYLVNSVAACGNCHTPKDAGGKAQDEKLLSGGWRLPLPQATVFGANITQDLETGIGKWTDDQIVQAIREGVRPDGSIIGPPMPIEMYRNMSDDDVKAIVAYLKTVPPVRNAVSRGKYEFPVPKSYGPPITTPVLSAPAGDPVKYGEYLAGPVGHCMACHTGKDGVEPTDQELRIQPGSGGRPFGPGGDPTARNLTPHEQGLKDWSDKEIETAIRTGARRDGTKLKPPMPFFLYQNISDVDMKAIIAYLRSLKPLPTGG
jgi:mono/diheme cytochrome c family protein